MEDNEFEEVTIISHTDHGTSVLPQSTAERLMKEIKLEVTQKISQNENVKLGSLQHSTTPTLLDPPDAEEPADSLISFKINSHLITFGFDTERQITRSIPFWQRQIQLFSQSHKSAFEGFLKEQLEERDPYPHSFSVVEWGEYYVSFIPRGKIVLLRRDNMEKLFASTSKILECFIMIYPHITFINIQREVTQIDLRSLTETCLTDIGPV